MSYRTDLEWIGNLSQLSEDEQKVLLALSSEKYRWRTRERLLQKTKLSNTKILDDTLAFLIKKGVVRPAFSQNGNIIYGLVERVGN